MAESKEEKYILPHHQLIAFSVAKELVLAVIAGKITDATLRDQALRAAKSASLNTAEGASRLTNADKKRVFAIARAEAAEAATAVEAAVACDAVTAAHEEAVRRIADRLYGMLSGLLR